MRDLLFTKAAPAAFANRLSFCPRIPRRASPAPLRPQGAEYHDIYFPHKDVPRGAKIKRGKRVCSTWNIKEERVAEGVNVPRGTMSGKKEKNQSKCNVKKKKPDQKRSKKIPPEKAVFLSDEGRSRTTPKMKRIKIAVFRAAARAGCGSGQQDYSGRKDYSSTTVVQPYLSSQRPYWISCNLL